MKLYSAPMYAVNYLKWDNKKQDFKQSSFSYVINCTIGGNALLTLTLTDEKDDPTVYLKIVLNENYSVSAKMGKVDSKGKMPLWVTHPDDAYNSNQALMVFEHFCAHRLPVDLLDNTLSNYLAFDVIKSLIVEKFSDSFSSGKTLVTRIDDLDKNTVLKAWTTLPNEQHLGALKQYAEQELAKVSKPSTK